jgi:hypothetical protein
VQVDCMGTSKRLGTVYDHTQGSVTPSHKVHESFFMYLISFMAPPSQHKRGAKLLLVKKLGYAPLVYAKRLV